MEIRDFEYETVSKTALVTSYPRIFTDIPYEKEIYNALKCHPHEEVVLEKNLAPEIEARYKLIDQLACKYKAKQVLELAAGYSSRGLNYSKEKILYVEMDLENVSKNKKEIVKTIVENIPSNYLILSGNVLRKNDFLQCEKYFKQEKPVVVINEGLLRYFTFDEKRQVALNIHDFLSKHGGVWITSDVTPKRFINAQNEALQNFNQNLFTLTSRNTLNDRFRDINHIKDFFGAIGFEVAEIHKFNEVINDLYSVQKLNIINDKIEETLEQAIVVVFRVKKDD